MLLKLFSYRKTSKPTLSEVWPSLLSSNVSDSHSLFQYSPVIMFYTQTLWPAKLSYHLITHTRTSALTRHCVTFLQSCEQGIAVSSTDTRVLSPKNCYCLYTSLKGKRKYCDSRASWACKPDLLSEPFKFFPRLTDPVFKKQCFNLQQEKAIPGKSPLKITKSPIS